MLHDACSRLLKIGPTIYLSLEKDRQMTEFRGLYEIMGHIWTSVGPTWIKQTWRVDYLGYFFFIFIREDVFRYREEIHNVCKGGSRDSFPGTSRRNRKANSEVINFFDEFSGIFCDDFTWGIQLRLLIDVP